MAESSALTVKDYMQSAEVQQKIKELLRDRAPQFTTSVLSIVGGDDKLAACVPKTLFSAALTAASLDLPINKNLGFAHIIAYENRKKGVTEAQFQIGYKGFIQLAQRSGQYKTIAATPVYEGQLVDENPLTGNTYDWKAKASDKVVGYVAYFKLLNGFEKDFYMTVDELGAHGKKFSQSFKKGYGLWVDDFNSMALKTVVKLLISKWGPQNTELQKALVSDQSVIDDDAMDYIDNDKSKPVLSDEEKAKIKSDAKDIAARRKEEAAKEGEVVDDDKK